MGSPLVVADTPLWAGRWDYGVERERLRDAGVTLVAPADETENVRLLAAADVVLRGGRLIDRGVIDLMRRCVGIVTYSVGLDGVDVAAATEAGIAVRNVPDYCTEEVSDHAVALLLTLLRRLPHWLDVTARGGWLIPEEQLTLRRLSALTAGIIGAGRVGRAVARKVRAFGIDPIAHDPYVADVGVELPLVPLAELLERADAIVLCASVTASAPLVFDRAAIDALGRDRPVLVNVGRGSLVDERAVCAALRDGRLAAAALDVRQSEPPPTDDPLAGVPNLFVTPHVAAASIEAIADLRAGVVQATIDLLTETGRLASV